MKMQPEFKAIPMSQDPCHADRLETWPELQIYAADCATAIRRHDHILRAALLANGCAAQEPYRQ